MSKFSYEVEWNGDSYAVTTKVNGEEVLVSNGNLWDAALECDVPNFPSLDAWALDQAKGHIASFEATGLTLWQQHNDGLRSTWDTVDQNGRIVANWPNEDAARKASEIPHPWHGKLRAVARSEKQAPEVPHF